MSQTPQPPTPATKHKSLCVVVGDISADKHVSKLVSEIQKRAPDLEIFGVGGPQMAAEGVELLYDCQDFAAVGFVRLIHKVPMFARIRQDVLRQIKERKPDAVLLVDFGGFNISFSSAVRNRYRDLPIIYFISPQVWGSRPWRLNELARNISKMLVIFPFEEAIYLRRGIPARFVGHPLMKDASRFEEPGNRADFARQHGLDPEAPLIAVFPGSRKQEIKDHCPVVTDAIKWLRAERPAVQFVICQSNEKIGGLIREHLTKAGLAALIGRGIQLIDSSESYKLLKNADVAWAKSGTTTLETTLCGTPMLIFYRADWISYLLFLAAKRVKRVGWPNLLAGRSLVPELIQLDCRAEKLVRYTLDLIDVPALRNEISTELKKLRDQLGQGDFDENAAAEILEIIGCNRQILNPLKP